MSRKLTLDINFIDTPRDGDVFGYQISNNGQIVSFSGNPGWNKTFKASQDYTNANGNITSLNTDLTPNVSDNTNIGVGFNGVVNVIKKQSDGKYICVGGFTSYQGTALTSRKICRLNTDFTLDTSFTPPDFQSDLPTLEIDSNDKIYLGSSNVTSGKGRLVRLNANGTLDTGYVTIGFDRPVQAIKLQADGKLIVTGVFTTFNGSPAKGIIRLTTSGIKDTTFNGVVQGFVLNSSFPKTIDLLSDGKIVIGGDFYSYNNSSCGNIVILTTTGAVAHIPTDLDDSPGGSIPENFSENVLKVLVDASDRIYVTGKFERYGSSVACNKIIRLYKNSFNNYVPDLTFNVISQGLSNGTSTLTTGGFDMILNDDSNLVVVGDFGTVQGSAVQDIAVLSETGVLSPNSEDITGTFAGSAPTIKTILNLGDRFIIGGTFNSYTNTGVAPVSSPFIIPIGEDITFNFGTGFNNLVYSTLKTGDGYLLGGDFSTYSGASKNKIVKLTPSGSIDTSFNIGTGFSNVVYSTLKTYDDGYLVGGDFTSYSGVSINRIVKLTSTGDVDTSFNIGAGFDNYVYPMIKTSDNNYMIGGLFSSYSGVSANRLIKLTPTGTIDTSFSIGTGFNNLILSIVETSDNGYLVGGYFTSYSGISANKIIKLTSTGSIDTSFVIGTGFNQDVYTIIKTNDGGYLVGGNFTTYKGTTTNKLVKLTSNGSIDASFNVGTGFNNYVYTITPTNDGSYLVGGDFTTYNGVSINRIVKLTANGSIDTSFNVGSGFNQVAVSINIISNQLYLISGAFTSYNGTTVNRILFVDNLGNITTTVDSLVQTIQNTYDNLTQFNLNSNIVYTLFSDKVEMVYTFDDDEIVIEDVYDTPDYVEITYINESLTINEIIDEVVVRSPLLIKSAVGTYDSVNYKVRIFDGNLFTSLTYPVLYDITKQKLFDGQANVYININNYVREKLEADIVTILNNNYYNGTSIPINMSKWVRVDETLLLTGSTVDTNINYLLATDGYLFNDEDQYIPNVLLSGLKRYCRYNQPQNIYYQTNFLVNIIYLDSLGTEVKISSDKNLELLNWQYINSLAVNTAVDWVQYTFNYSNSAPINVRYEMYSDCQFEPYTLVFKNKWGMLESIPMSRKSITTLNTQSKDYNRSILDYNGNYDINRHTNKQYNVNGYDSWTLNSNWLPEYMNLSLEELMLSEEVWLLDSNNEIIPVIKEDQNLTFKTELNDRMIQYTIKVKMSHSKIKNIL